nr:PREDICTED: carbonic anhydrase-related protein [Struthio camelus australis]
MFVRTLFPALRRDHGCRAGEHGSATRPIASSKLAEEQPRIRTLFYPLSTLEGSVVSPVPRSGQGRRGKGAPTHHGRSSGCLSGLLLGTTGPPFPSGHCPGEESYRGGRLLPFLPVNGANLLQLPALLPAEGPAEPPDLLETEGEAKFDPSLLEVRLSPNYVVCRDCEVINDGHSIQIVLKSKSVLIGGPLPRGHEFELHDVRFHWGRENQRGSEHTVNFKAFPMELHLMHWNSTLYSSIDEAVGKKHGIAIVALFVQIGKEHVGLKAVTEILQDIQYKGKSKTIPCFNPNSLLPDPLLRDYWVYEGSLTIPPCSEGVTWILFRYPLTVSQVQIEEFRRLRTHVKGAELLEGCDGILGDNFRPTQPLSDRVIRAAFQ